MANDTRGSETSHSIGWWLFVIAAILLGVLFVMWLASLNTSPNMNVAQDTPSATGGFQNSETPTSISDILANPVAFTGNTVRVEGEVERSLGARAFILDELGLIQDQIVVITRSDTPNTEGNEVVVTGTVRSATVAEIERELNLDLSEEIEVEITQKPVIMADSVEPQNETGTVDGVL